MFKVRALKYSRRLLSYVSSDKNNSFSNCVINGFLDFSHSTLERLKVNDCVPKTCSTLGTQEHGHATSLKTGNPVKQKILIVTKSFPKLSFFVEDQCLLVFERTKKHK